MHVLRKIVFAWRPLTATFEERRMTANQHGQRKYTALAVGQRVWWRYVHLIGPAAERGVRKVPVHYAIPLD